MTDTATRYDSYWRLRDEARTKARSRSRAFLALRLLEEAGCVSRESSPLSLYEIGCGPAGLLRFFARPASRRGGVMCLRRLSIAPGSSVSR